MAPGEAEAECALLQQQGVVDAVLSEDVDTLMFGCGLSLRKWSGEGNNRPSHVDVYDAKKTKQGKSGLDREGMVLVALLSGGDYVTEGVPGCGIKIACEAARAGFGKELCALSPKDSAGRQVWREKLAHEFQTNENKYFKAVHKAIKLPADFPDKAVLGYYTHPVVSSLERVEKLGSELQWDQEINIAGLRTFTAEAFDWTYMSGARKFIRCLAPALLVHKLRTSSEGEAPTSQTQGLTLITAICGSRKHMSNDGEPEIRVVYLPTDIVGLDLEAEEPDPQYDQNRDTSDDDLAPEGHDDGNLDAPGSPTKRRAPSAYDPTQPQKEWVLETFVKLGAPLMVEDWEESRRNPKKYLAAKGDAKKKIMKKKPTKKAAANGGMKHGALDSFVKIGKPGAQAAYKSLSIKLLEARVGDVSTDDEFPPLFLAPSITKPIPPRTKVGPHSSIHDEPKDCQKSACSSNLSHEPTKAAVRPALSLTYVSSTSQKTANQDLDPHDPNHPSSRSIHAALHTPTKSLKPKKSAPKPISSPIDLSTPTRPNLDTNPWTLSRRPPETLNMKLPRGARYSALGIFGPTDTSISVATSSDIEDNENGLQSPPSSPLVPTLLKKHARPESSSSSCSSTDSHLRSKDQTFESLSENRNPEEPATSLPTPPSRSKVTSPPQKKRTPRKSNDGEVISPPDFDDVMGGKPQAWTPDNDEAPSSPTIPPLDTLLSPTLPIQIDEDKSASPSPSIIEILSSSPPIIEAERLASQITIRRGPKPGKDRKGKDGEAKRRIVLRQSCEGAWREEEDGGSGMRTGNGGWRRSQVEVVDMTGGI